MSRNGQSIRSYDWNLCFHCRQRLDQHARRKCLYEPTYFADDICIVCDLPYQGFDTRVTLIPYHTVDYYAHAKCWAHSVNLETYEPWDKRYTDLVESNLRRRENKQ